MHGIVYEIAHIIQVRTAFVCVCLKGGGGGVPLSKPDTPIWYGPAFKISEEKFAQWQNNNVWTLKVNIFCILGVKGKIMKRKDH